METTIGMDKTANDYQIACQIWEEMKTIKHALYQDTLTGDAKWDAIKQYQQLEQTCYEYMHKASASNHEAAEFLKKKFPNGDKLHYSLEMYEKELCCGCCIELD